MPPDVGDLSPVVLQLIPSPREVFLASLCTEGEMLQTKARRSMLSASL